MLKINTEYKFLLELLKPTIKTEEAKMLDLAFAKLQAYAKKSNNEVEISEILITARIAMEEIGLQAFSIVCIFLLNPYKSKIITIDELKNEFGEKIAKTIVEIEKISDLNVNEKSLKSDYINALLKAVSNDIRVILIKLAQHLHIIRTFVESTKEEKDKIVSETEYLYAPFAHRAGLYNIKLELEDSVMKIKNPQMFHSIQDKIIETERSRESFINYFLKPINEKLKSQNYDFKISWRTKSISSIYRKIQKQNVEFEEVYDLFAIRIIIESKEKSDCWKVYSIVSDLYIPNTNRLRDWISFPKNNGYESLHTTVMSKEGKWVEIQIRTKQMDEIAEMGMAAHWKYKSEQKSNTVENWIQKTREMLVSQELDKEDKIDSFKADLYSNEIFVFTPNGDLKKFPKGSTILDFAFDIHTKIGMTCQSAKINNKLVPLKYVLKNGDQVFIITSKNQRAREDWLKFVKTTKAKSKIKKILKEEKNKEADNGKEILKRKLKNWKLKFDDETVSFLLKSLKIQNAIDFYSAIARDTIEIQDIKNVLLSSNESETIIPETAVAAEDINSKPEKEKDYFLIDGSVDNINYRFAKCCNPIFGDNVFGYVTIGTGISIHRKNCPNAKNLVLNNKFRIKTIKWKTDESNASFKTAIRISGDDRVGMLEEITKLISSDLKLNMRGINLNSSKDEFIGTINIVVKSTTHLHIILQKLRKIKGIRKVVRSE
ncbi:MAG: bifunctional (p)ppGpp synthetase/guanosine-3',5'-bis(diphosphate) 3'-pyrophosphohydrolase [Bacteroidetes bacterium]|jgi:GTP diphosphokinase / guanosine-3',5'-bis(diphosphate) 3'-diphosphatase|nr:bifunctional (p)ppGpp synthetase/guanosine-3',5'-bis(diphosphate) 3'-pyrophosphohydrolase [Bacteroidota bacterium]MBT6684878.1 bifunctional (p)ppGpp synthetase/guanosine-3',5'-bis(diphosphate) 3'-pyrophosphohydrolase [Bacteroidota bacterium]MBT7142572.1 bifunctional (p)ppGpp synthetase/guanosine-3',5'-bis(diphosphate) 3'-pyrophosphohydrolase [Bacteroidota bacterium]MBT7493269.1 bifunctional (p)ppGpp synthetase/guanosine-3',5'-bis(diphosphate) 3'-pyrophosphohydrolase [Bacteroidota bacterium]